MPRLSCVPPELTWGPFTTEQAAAAGMTRRQLRSGAWRRIGHGVYISAAATVDELTRLAAATHHLPPQAVFSVQTAGWLHGLDLAATSPIDVTLGYDQPVAARAGVRIRRAKLDPSEIVTRHGLPVTSPLRTVTDCGRLLPLVSAVIALDMALHAGLVTLSELVSFVGRSPGRRHVRNLRQAVSLADEKAESPMETRLRVAIVRAGLPRPEAQGVIRDAAGQFVARADLLYREARIAIEYDGGTHRDSLADDNRRQNRLLAEGYRVLRFSAGDLSGRSEAVVAQVRAALTGQFSKERR